MNRDRVLLPGPRRVFSGAIATWSWRTCAFPGVGGRAIVVFVALVLYFPFSWLVDDVSVSALVALLDQNG